jgi:hypothetical protein
MPTIRYLAEQALVNYLTAASLGVDVVAGCAKADKDAPLVICTAREWAEDETGLNWYRVKCTVETKMLATSTSLAFDTLCAAVRDALRITDLGTELAGAQAGIVFAEQGISAPDAGEFTISEDAWIETRQLELYCALTS